MPGISFCSVILKLNPLCSGEFQWRKAWSPWPTLPPCVITHCVDPFPIPEDSDLEEAQPNWITWTPINTEKLYQCTGSYMEGAQRIHTKFFESDRSLSSFTMMCKSDGSFQFENVRSQWPTCLEGKARNLIIYRYKIQQNIYHPMFQILSVHLLPP